jgi:tetratricopeptide (TPR) repeat protein
MNRFLDATRYFDLVFQKEDTITFSLKYTGLAHFHLNDFDKAQYFLERCIVYDSTDYDPFIILGQVYLQKDEFEKGLACLNRAEKINYPPSQKWSEIFKTKADIYNQQNEWDKAIECFQQAYKLNPEDKTLICKLAYQYDYLNQKEKAISLYTQVIETADPTVYVTEVKLAKERLEKLKQLKSRK